MEDIRAKPSGLTQLFAPFMGGDVEYSDAVNPAQVDGTTSFVESLFGFGSDLLKSNGVQPDAPLPSQTPQASVKSGSVGLDASTLGVIALVGVGAWLVFSK